MKWSNYDRNQITNLVIALKKAKFEMTGLEVVAFADVFKWVSGLHDFIEKELAPKPPIVLTPDSVTQPQPEVSSPEVQRVGKKKSKI